MNSDLSNTTICRDPYCWCPGLDEKKCPWCAGLIRQVPAFSINGIEICEDCRQTFYRNLAASAKASGQLDASGILDGMEPATVTRHIIFPSAWADAMKATLGDAATGTSKEDLTKQVQFLADMQKMVNSRLPKYVEKLRKAGASWEDVGSALGMSKQAAWERFK